MLANQNAIEGGDYAIANSLRFRASASAWLSKTFAGAGNRLKWTWSAWVKRGTLSSIQTLFASAVVNGSSEEYIAFDASDNLRFHDGSSGTLLTLVSNAYRDPAAWYHIMYVYDSAQGTQANRGVFYINGVAATASTNGIGASRNSYINGVLSHGIARFGAIASNNFDGYLAEVNFIDGQALTPSSFGQTDLITGSWTPKKYTGTYGTNGFYLPFSNGTSTATLGNDSSGNANNWTTNNLSLTAGATYDWMVDTPTNNYMGLGSLSPASWNSSVCVDGNLSTTPTFSTQVNVFANQPLPASGKWYWEVTCSNPTTFGITVGLRSVLSGVTAGSAGSGGYVYYSANGNKINNGVSAAYGTSWGSAGSNTIGVAYDAGTGALSFYLNNVSQGAAFTVPAGTYFPAGSHESGSGSHTEYWNFGQRPFAYTPPSGYTALATSNLPTPTITNPKQHFAALTWTGDGNTRTISGLNFQTDFNWTRSRSVARNHAMMDSVRGFTTLRKFGSNLTVAEGDTTNYPDWDGYISAVSATGFTISKNGTGAADWAQYNSLNELYMSWNWKAGGAAVSNTAGSIASQVSANVAAGFSIVTYSGTLAAAGTATVGHGLGVVPAMIISKSRSVAGADAGQWVVRHKGLTNANYYLRLNTQDGQTDSTANGSMSNPTSSVFSTNWTSGINVAGNNYVAYCIAEIPGYSKVGTYTGNGSADGPFVHCGFKPAAVFIKRVTTTGSNARLFDTARSVNNANTLAVYPDLANVEDSTSGPLDMTATGFKVRGTTAGDNTNGETYIFWAIADFAFGGAGIAPATAR